MRVVWILSLLALAVLPLSGEPAGPNLPDGLYAQITTPRGVVVAELYFKKAPLTVTSFVGLAEGTLGPKPRHPFYDGLTFLRVMPDFLIQGGDPMGTGDGDAGYLFPDEFVPGLHHDGPGVLQMANGGPDSNGSQWCIMLHEARRLNYLHNVFGRVIQGLDVLPKIRKGDTMHVEILRVGAEAKAFKADDASLDGLIRKAKRYNGSKEPGPKAHFDDPDKLLPSEPPRAKYFNYQLANFQRATGQRIVARLFAKTPVAKPEEIGHYLRTLAQETGTDKSGALAVYLADRKEWRLWIGDEWLGAFLGNPSLKPEDAPQSQIHEAKLKFLTAARSETDAAIADAEKKTGGKALPENQKLKLWADAVLDDLIAEFEPKQ